MEVQLKIYNQKEKKNLLRKNKEKKLSCHNLPSILGERGRNSRNKIKILRFCSIDFGCGSIRIFRFGSKNHRNCHLCKHVAHNLYEPNYLGRPHITCSQSKSDCTYVYVTAYAVSQSFSYNKEIAKVPFSTKIEGDDSLMSWKLETNNSLRIIL